MKRIERDIREQFRITDRNVAIAAVLVYGQIHVWNPYRILYSFPGIHRVSA